MNFIGTDTKVRSEKCCVVFDSKDGRIRYVHSVITMEGADETPDDAVAKRALKLASDFGIDTDGVKTLHIDPSSLKPNVEYAVNLKTGSLTAVGKQDL
jgi:hypothetical protein